MITETKTYMLSFEPISRLLTSGPVYPSTFILKAEEFPPINFTDEILNFWLFSLIILNEPVTEPVVVNTVSNFKVSAERVTWASGLVINDSFLQANKRMQRDKIKRLEMIFIGIKNNRRIRDYRLE